MDKSNVQKALIRLHADLANTHIELISSGESTTADRKEAREFLKDNGIDGLASAASPLRSLVDELDHIPDDDVAFG